MSTIKIILLLGLFTLVSHFSKSQTREDTTKYLDNLSRQYLNALFNKRDIGLARTFWNTEVFNDLRAGYNNGRISYKTDGDLVSLFSHDFKIFFKGYKKIMRFGKIDHSDLINEDDGKKYFIISFNLDKKVDIDSSLKVISLNFSSINNGKTWQLNADHWIKNFMYYRYRENKH